MSFCISPSICKKCGKPLTLFEGWHCLECEAKEHTSDKLCAIRAEIEQTAKVYDKFDDYRRVRGLWIALDIIDKYKEKQE